jgi:xanthine dehydrogenase accessory factor
VAAPESSQENYPEVDRVQANFNLTDLNVSPHTFIVVSTQGECDEEALENALRTDANYVAFVASKVKATKVLTYLAERGVGPERLSRVKAPAGMNIGAKSPEEIAVSILAEIVQLSRAKVISRESRATSAVVQQEAKDPICGMTVNINTAIFKSKYDDKEFYFCCAGCKGKFDNQPDLYARIHVSA